MNYLPHFVSHFLLLDVTISVNGVSFDVTYLCVALLVLFFVRSLGSDSTKRRTAKVVKLSVLFLLLNVSAFGQTEKEKCRGVEFVISTLHEHFDTSNHIEAVISVLPIGGSEDDAILLQMSFCECPGLVHARYITGLKKTRIVRNDNTGFFIQLTHEYAKTV